MLIDGINAREYKVEDVRSLIGYVPQKNVLFSGDISENLNFGNEHGEEKDWKRAAEIACTEEFISKKEKGYHDPIAQGRNQSFRRPASAYGYRQGNDEKSRKSMSLMTAFRRWI